MQQWKKRKRKQREMEKLEGKSDKLMEVNPISLTTILTVNGWKTPIYSRDCQTGKKQKSRPHYMS